MRKSELEMEIARTPGTTVNQSREETTSVIDRLVHFAGWTDKLVRFSAR